MKQRLHDTALLAVYFVEAGNASSVIQPMGNLTDSVVRLCRTSISETYFLPRVDVTRYHLLQC